jgi:hypothetical protein
MKDACVDESSKRVVMPGVVSTFEGGGKVASKKLDSMEEEVYLERWRREATSWARIALTCSSQRRRRQGSRRSPRSRVGVVPGDQRGTSRKNERAVIKYKFKKMLEKVVVRSDTDVAGCERVRKST